LVDTDYEKGRFGALFFVLKTIINSSMTDTNIIDRQPTKFDYASPIQFRFKMTKLPQVEFFCTNSKYTWYYFRVYKF